MSSLLGCFAVFLPSSSGTRAAILGLDDDLEQLIDPPANTSDISSLSSHVGTTTSASSFRGIGSLSGKAIMAVGSLMIRGIEVVDIRVRLRRIATQLGQEDSGISSAAMEDLFELQRAGLYPKTVRRRAMQLVVLVMCRRRTYEQLVNTLVRQPVEEIRLFLQQLCSLKFSIKKLVPRLITEISEEDTWAYREKRESSLSDRFCGLVLAVIHKHPSILLDDTDSTPLFEVILHLIRIGRADDVSLSSWDDTEVQRYIYKLNSSRLSGWVSYKQLQMFPFVVVTIHDSPHEPFDRRLATDGFCDIISNIIEARPSILCHGLPVEQTSEILALLFERRHFRSVVSTLLASKSEDVREYLLRLAKGESRTRQPGGFLIDIVDEGEIIARAERQANFCDLLRRIHDWHPFFLHEVFSLEHFTILIATAVDEPAIPPRWESMHLLLYHFADRASVSPLRTCFLRFIENARE